jgi:hypothetical protein
MENNVELLNTIHLSNTRASLRSDGILQLDVLPGSHNTVAHVKEAIEALGKTSGGKCYPLLIIAGKDASIDTEAMTFMAKENADPYSIAVAYLISSISQKLLGNFYLKFNKPSKTTRIFTSKEQALEWLAAFKTNENS